MSRRSSAKTDLSATAFAVQVAPECSASSHDRTRVGRVTPCAPRIANDRIHNDDCINNLILILISDHRFQLFVSLGPMLDKPIG